MVCFLELTASIKTSPDGIRDVSVKCFICFLTPRVLIKISVPGILIMSNLFLMNQYICSLVVGVNFKKRINVICQRIHVMGYTLVTNVKRL